MPLEGEAKRLYQREYMRRRRAGLPTRAPPKPKGQCCSFCGQPPSRERIVIASARGVRICESCVKEVAALIAAQRGLGPGPLQGARSPSGGLSGPGGHHRAQRPFLG